MLATSTLASKYRKVATMDEFLERVFFLGKVAVTVLLYFVGLNYMAIYLLVWLGECCWAFSARTTEADGGM